MASTKRGGDKPKANGSAGFQEDPPRAGHNSEARLKALSEKLDQWCKLQKEEDDLIAKYVQPVRDKKNDVKAEAKKDLGTPTKAFNARAALRMIELEDDDEIVLAVNEMFRATPVGANLDLVALHERVEKKRAEKAAEKAAKQTKVTEGQEAAL